MRLRPMLQFGDFQFEPETPLLTRGGRSLGLSPKALQVLAVLVANAGRMVSKVDLLNMVWPNAMVEEGNLAVHIFALRKALGSGAESGDYIETIPKRGYRFAAQVGAIREGDIAGVNGSRRDACSVANYFLRQQTAEGCVRAARKYQECLATEARNVNAKTGLANTLLFRFVLRDLGRDEAVAPAEALLDDASQIDPACAEIRLNRARLFSLGYWQWDRAQGELQRAIESPLHGETEHIARAWQGCHLVERGDLEKGLALLCWANAGSPLNPFVSRFLAEAYFLARDFSTCEAVSRNALQLHPHSWLHHRVLARALTALGEFGQARWHYRRASVLYDSPQSGLPAEFAYLEAATGNKDNAAKRLARLQAPATRRSVSFASKAQIYAALGDTDRALDCLEQACANRDWSLSALKQDY